MIQSSGTVATFWQTSFVTARNMTDASAGRPIHAALSHQLTGWSPAAECLIGERASIAASDERALNVHQAQNAQQTANAANPSDHMAACCRESQWTSKKKG